MTEDDWLAATDPFSMLRFIWGRASDRKLRLFAVECCRRRWDLLVDKGSQDAVGAAELFADQDVSWEDMSEIRSKAESTAERSKRLAAYAAASLLEREMTCEIVQKIIRWIVKWKTKVDASTGKIVEFGPYFGSKRRVIVKEACFLDIVPLVSEIFGNPFRPVFVDPAWLTPTVVALAGTIYAERATALLPILGDALEDAGCIDAAILGHCRSQTEHVRGCWAVDAILGKS